MNTLNDLDIAVYAHQESDLASAKPLADDLSLKLFTRTDTNQTRYLLVQDGHQRYLIDQKNAKMRPLLVDFTEPSYARRLQQSSSKTLLAKAVGIKPKIRPNVIDATAGLGKDSFLLAYLGCKVTLVEASPIVHTLLSNGLERAFLQPEWVDLKSQMAVYLGEAEELLSSLPAAEVVYLDPMYPDNKKSALSKRDMQYLQSFLAKPKDMNALFAAALNAAEKRVVVKRPLKGRPLTEDRAPSYSLCGSSTRFDVYLC